MSTLSGTISGTIYNIVTSISSVINYYNVPIFYISTSSTISGNEITLSNYIIPPKSNTLSSYIYNYNKPTTNFFIDHNYYVSTGIYGNFYNYDYLDISKNVIIQAKSYIQRDISISGNIYCTNLYNYIANQYVSNQTLNQTITTINNNIASQLTNAINSISGVITVDLLQYVTNTSFSNYQQSTNAYIISLSGSIQNLLVTLQNLNITRDIINGTTFNLYITSLSGTIYNNYNSLTNIIYNLVDKPTFNLYVNSLSGSIYNLNNAIQSLNIPVIPSNLVNLTLFNSYINSLSGSILSLNYNLNNNYSTTEKMNISISDALSKFSLAITNPLYIGGTNGLMLQHDETGAYIRNLDGFLYLGCQDTNAIRISNNGLIIGNSSDGNSSSIIDSFDALYLTGKGGYPNRLIRLNDKVIINKSLLVSGECFLNTRQIVTCGNLSSTQFYSDYNIVTSDVETSKVFTCQTTPFYKKQITLNMPVSFSIYFGAYYIQTIQFYFKLTNIECKIYKNGNLWLTPNVTANYNVNYTGGINFQNVQAYVYVTMATVSFKPDDMSEFSDTYEVYLIPTTDFGITYAVKETLTYYYPLIKFNATTNDFTYTETPNNNNNFPKYFFLNYTNPGGYQPFSYTESAYTPTTTGNVYMNELFVNKIHMLGNVYINELFVNRIHYGSSTQDNPNVQTNAATTTTTTSSIDTSTTPTPTTTPTNVFQNIYLNTVLNASPLIDFGFNDSTRCNDAGIIKYNGSSSTLDIFGCGTDVGSRNIKLYDNVIINNGLTVNSTVNTLNCFTNNLSSTNCITSLFTCDVLTNKNSASLGTVNINDSLNLIYPLTVGKNTNNNSINCSGNITTNDIYCNDLYYTRSINNVDVISNLLTISNQIYSLNNSITTNYINCNNDAVIEGQLNAFLLSINYEHCVIDNYGNIFTVGSLNINDLCRINGTTGDITCGLINGQSIQLLAQSVNNFTSDTHSWSGQNTFTYNVGFAAFVFFGAASTVYFLSAPIFPSHSISDSALSNNVVLYNSDYITNNNNNISTLSGLIYTNKTILDNSIVSWSGTVTSVSIISTNLNNLTTNVNNVTNTVTSHTNAINTLSGLIYTNTNTLNNLIVSWSGTVTSVSIISTNLNNLTTTVTSHTNAIKTLSGLIYKINSNPSNASDIIFIANGDDAYLNSLTIGNFNVDNNGNVNTNNLTNSGLIISPNAYFNTAIVDNLNVNYSMYVNNSITCNNINCTTLNNTDIITYCYSTVSGTLYNNTKNFTSTNLTCTTLNVGTGNTTINGYLFSKGLATRTGINGTYGGNRINFYWSGTQLALWVDATNLGNFTICDYRIKKYIKQPMNVLNRISSLKMIDYEFKDIGIFRNDNASHLGLYAHELQDAFPEYKNLVINEKDAVDENNNIKPQSVSNDLVFILMKAVQELKLEVDNLKALLNL